VLVGSFDPMRRKHDAWIDGVRAAARAINRAGGKAKLTYRPTECRPKFRWKYLEHKRKLRLEDAAAVDVYLVEDFP
jgi:hypothetical protein